MTRATFGEFLQAARRHLDGPATRQQTAGTGGSAEEVSRSLLRVVTIMGHYLHDIAPSLGSEPQRAGPAPGPWAQACQQATRATMSAAKFLGQRRPPAQWPLAPAASPLAQRLDATAMSLAAGRDLLQTHFAVDPDRTVRHGSEWAPVIASAPVSRALLAEIAALARRSAHHGANSALAPFPSVYSGDSRRQLSAACQWLWILDASIRSAHQREPVIAADRDLLLAIPANATPERPLLIGDQPVGILREAVTRSAERVRRRAWTSTHHATHPSWVTALSLREAADAGTVVSHHCHLLFRALSDRSARAGHHEISEYLLAAAGQAEQARQRWLQTAHALRQVTTDPRLYLAPVAGETRDLALATGRLVYADPAWTLASGPAHSVRSPMDLVPHLYELPATVAAAHQASDTLTSLARGEQDRIRAAAQAGRILVPLHSLPDGYDIPRPRPFAQAPGARVDMLLAHYREAEQASRQATVAAEEAAEATNAPSRILTAARSAAVASNQAGVDHPSVRSAERVEPVAGGPELAGQFGPVEGTLRRLGVTRPELLARGADLDRVGERLVIDAAADLGSARRCPDALELNRSPGATALINRALVSGDPSAVALLQQPAPPSREPPEPEAQP